MDHTARNPSHQSFRFIVTHFWRMTAADGTVEEVVEPHSAPKALTPPEPAR
jgi:hypothetical protein